MSLILLSVLVRKESICVPYSGDLCHVYKPALPVHIQFITMTTGVPSETANAGSIRVLTGLLKVNLVKIRPGFRL